MLQPIPRSAHMSQSHFRKVFRETHGESPRALQTRARMQKACELVLHSGLALTQIAARLGFSTVHNFSRAVKQATGVWGSEYRRRMLGPTA